MGSFLSRLSGGRRRGGLPLEDSDRVPERVAEAHVSAVEVVDRLLGEVRDATFEPCTKAAIELAGNAAETASLTRRRDQLG
jgi:hypothetical protein